MPSKIMEDLLGMKMIRGIRDHIVRKQQKKAVDRYYKFHGVDAENMKQIMLPNMSHLIKLGIAKEIRYEITENTKSKYIDLWKHKFVSDQMLLTNATGDVLIILGKMLKVTDRGITG